MILEALANDAVNLIYSHYIKEENKGKIDEISDDLFKLFFNKIRPYFLMLAVLLLILVLVNCVQFYYYIKIFLKQVDASKHTQTIKDIIN